MNDRLHVVERFAAFAEAFRAQPLPDQVLHHAKRAVIDWHAALYPGAAMAPATLLERALAEELDRGGARPPPRPRGPGPPAGRVTCGPRPPAPGGDNAPHRALPPPGPNHPPAAPARAPLAAGGWGHRFSNRRPILGAAVPMAAPGIGLAELVVEPRREPAHQPLVSDSVSHRGAPPGAAAGRPGAASGPCSRNGRRLAQPAGR